MRVSVCPERPRVSAGTTGPPRVSLCHVEVGGCEKGGAGTQGSARFVLKLQLSACNEQTTVSGENICVSSVGLCLREAPHTHGKC